VKKIGPFLSITKTLHSYVYETRIRNLTQQIILYLHEGDRVLDVGCGYGILGERIMKHPFCPPHVEVLGLEKIKREGTLIAVKSYDGDKIPYPNKSFDIVILADVLHHESNPHLLTDECTRVAKRSLIIKDHKIDGIFAQQRISLLDWVANEPHGIPCLYRYNTLREWRDFYKRHRLTVKDELCRMTLYPPVLDFFFGGRLQYFAVLCTDTTSTALQEGHF